MCRKTTRVGTMGGKPLDELHGYADDDAFRQEQDPRGDEPLREQWWWGQNTADHRWRHGMAEALANRHYYPTKAHAAAELRGMADYYMTLARRLEEDADGA